MTPPGDAGLGVPAALLEELFQQIIVPDYLLRSDPKPQRHPEVMLLGGQPGAGKSTAAAALQRVVVAAECACGIVDVMASPDAFDEPHTLVPDRPVGAVAWRSSQFGDQVVGRVLLKRNQHLVFAQRQLLGRHPAGGQHRLVPGLPGRALLLRTSKLRNCGVQLLQPARQASVLSLAPHRPGRPASQIAVATSGQLLPVHRRDVGPRRAEPVQFPRPVRGSPTKQAQCLRNAPSQHMARCGPNPLHARPGQPGLARGLLAQHLQHLLRIDPPGDVEDCQHGGIA